MSVKCRSCGFTNPDNRIECEHCGCNLKYSRVFEKIHNKEKEKTFLFDLFESKSEVENEDFLFDHSEEEILNTELNTEDEYKPVSTKNPVPQKRSKISSQIENNEKSIRKLGASVTIEFAEFTFFFLFYLLLSNMFFNNFNISSIDIAKASFAFYVFFNFHSLILTGKMLSQNIIKNGEDN